MIIQIGMIRSELELQSVAFTLELLLLTEKARFLRLHLLQPAFPQIKFSLLHGCLRVKLADFVVEFEHLIAAAVELLHASI